MKNFDKAKKLDHVCYDVRGPVLEEAEKMIQNGETVLKLNIGNPAPFHFSAPEEILEEMIKNLKNAEGYSDSKGLLSAREAILDYCHYKGIHDLTVNDIYTGNGVSELIVTAMQGLLNPGDEVLLPSPDYPLWTAAVTLSGGTPVHYVCDEEANWYPDIADIRKKISPRTKGLVLINPNNPTGALYPKALLEEVIELARQNDIILFADEIYDRLVMDGLTHDSVAALAPDLFTVTFNGLSKSHKIAGFRAGWMCLNGDKKRYRGYIEGLNMLSSMRLCANVPAQFGIPAALKEFTKVDTTLLPGGRIFEQREFIYKALNEIPGMSAVKPKAAFYIFPKIDTKKFNITNDEQFVLDFLKAQKVLLVHGGGFHYPTPDHFRIVYLPEMAELKEAMDRLAQFLSTYQQDPIF